MTSDEKHEASLAYARRYYEQHREALKAKRRERYLANRDKELASNRRYNHRHREELNAYKRDYRQANLERIRQQERRRYSENRERICAQHRTPEYRAHQKELRKRRKIRIVSENLARVKQSLIYNKEANEKRAKQVSVAKGLAQMGDFVPRHKKFRDPND